jgi:hypothetical protein
MLFLPVDNLLLELFSQEKSPKKKRMERKGVSLASISVFVCVCKYRNNLIQFENN